MATKISTSIISLVLLSVICSFLPDHIDQKILKDEIILLTSKKAIKTGISEHKLRLLHVYKEDENKVIAIITNQLDWQYNTIADLYKKRWDI